MTIIEFVPVIISASGQYNVFSVQDDKKEETMFPGIVIYVGLLL